MNVTFERYADELADEALDRDPAVVTAGTLGTTSGKTAGSVGSVIER